MPKQPLNKPLRRGDVVLVPFPNSDLRSAKIRPAIVVQSNTIDSELPQVIVAMISSNLRREGRRPRILIDTRTEAGALSGLLVNSVIMTDNLSTVLTSGIFRVIGKLNDLDELDAALRHSLDL